MRRLDFPLATFAILALVLTPRWADAQPAPSQKAVAVPGDGTELFRGLLDKAGIKPVTSQDLRNPRLLQWDDIILISLGNPDGSLNRSFRPSDYYQGASARGGLLIATDTFLRLTSSDSQATLDISGDKVICRGTKAIHDRRISCPYLVPSTTEDDKDYSKVFRGLNRIATNSPSFITLHKGFGGDFQNSLAKFPPNCSYGFNGFILDGSAVFAVGGEGPDESNNSRYRLLVMADHSIFINQMLLEPGTENIELAYRSIEYLQGPNKRMKCLFFENGQHIEHFDDLRRNFGTQNQMPLPQVNLWAMQDKLTDLGNSIIDRLESNDAHNRLLLGSGREPGDQYRTLNIIARFFVVLAAAVACFFLLRRAWSTRKPTDIPPAPPVVGAPSGPPGVFDRRQKELLRRNNVFEPIRDLVREFFLSVGVHGEPGVRPLKPVISDVVRKPESLRTAIKDFWKIAFGPPQVITVSRWRELEPFFDRVRQAHTDGKWRFVQETTAGSVE